MNWFDILKISFKPVDRDRPAPKISVREGSTPTEVGSYNPETDEINLTPNPNVTPEDLADTLAHETTHEAQFKIEPLLKEIMKNAQNSIIALIFTVKETPIEGLSNNEIEDILEDVAFGVGDAIKLYLEQEMTIEIQAYSLERNFETREDRNKFAQLIISSFEQRIFRAAAVADIEFEKMRIMMTALIALVRPILERIFETFVRRERVGQ